MILGITFTHDGTLCLINKNGEVIFSAGEERFNRIKAYIGFPFKTLKFIMENKIVKPEDITDIAISTGVFDTRWCEIFAFELTENKMYYDLMNEPKPNNFYIKDDKYNKVKSENECKQYVLEKLKMIFEQYGINANIHFVNHHLSHAFAAYASSGFDETLIVTLDGEGDKLSGTVNIGKNGKIETLLMIEEYNSVGKLYSAITKLLSFKISRHEGKITGLAAYGKENENYDCFKSLIKVDKQGKIVLTKGRDIISKIKRKIKNFILMEDISMQTDILKDCIKNSTKEDIAYNIQKLLEEIVVEFIQYWLNKTSIKKVVLSGGVFANVKLNQHIGKLENIEKLFIHPNMGDGGNAYGAAIKVCIDKYNYKPNKTKFKHVYFGNSYKNEEVLLSLDKYKDKLDFYKEKKLYDKVSDLLIEGKIIGWFQGKMEYGPRALCNRSILAVPFDKNINNWLNERLNRTEFMPFAPVCLYEYADDIFYIKKESLKFPAEFMTITFDVKEEWINKIPAVVHIDNTARPQLVNERNNKKMYLLLKKFYEKTNIPVLINTSFNVHEEPIVCYPENAIQALLDKRIDILVIEDYIAWLK